MMSSVSFFSDLAPGDRLTIRDRCARRKVRKKEVIVRQGSHDREMYIVESGRLRISAVSEEGKEVGFGMLEPGDTFGEMAMLDGEERSATVTAIEACDLLVLGREEFERLVVDHPHIAINLLVILVQRLRHTSRMYQDSVFLEVPARLARFLLQFSRAAEQGESIPVLNLALSQYELGTLINASRESVNKQLRDWEESGVIDRSGSSIRLLRPAVLESIATHFE